MKRIFSWFDLRDYDNDGDYRLFSPAFNWVLLINGIILGINFLPLK